MISSTPRKLCLCGWLQENDSASFSRSLKLQKFLWFYEAFSKVDGDTYEFDHLRGYKRGPCFSHVWGDYTKENALFKQEAKRAYEEKIVSINDVRVKKCAFIVSTLTEMELSDITHKMNIWKAKESRIMRGESQVSLDEVDFSDEDVKFIKLLGDIYPNSLVESSIVYPVGEYNYVFKNEDIQKLTEAHIDTLQQLSSTADLCNPVFVEIDDDGRLIID